MDKSAPKEKKTRRGSWVGVTPTLLIHRVGAGMSVSRWHFGVLSLLLVLGVTGSLVTHVVVKGWETERIHSDFDRRFESVLTAFNRRMDANLAILNSIVGLQGVQNGVSRDSFQAMVSAAWTGQSSIQALGWAPRVDRRDLDRHVRLEVRDGMADYQVYEHDVETGERVLAGERSEYFPISYIEPGDVNLPLHGLDLGMETSLRVAMSRVLATGKSSATRKLSIPTDAGDIDAVVVLVPVHTPGTTIPTPAVPVVDGEGAAHFSRKVKGLAVGVFRVDELLRSAREGTEGIMEVSIADNTDGTSAGNRWVVGSQLEVATGDASYGFLASNVTSVGGREWVLSAKPTSAYLTSQRTWQAEGLLVAGLQFVALFVAYLRLIFSRSAEVERLVEQRTAELMRTSRRLKREMINRRTSERALHNNEERIKALFDIGTGRIDLATPGGTDVFSIARQAWANQGPPLEAEAEVQPEGFAESAESAGNAGNAADGGATEERIFEQMSTEIRSPIAAMVCAAKILGRHKTMTPEKVSKFADIVVNEGERLRCLINETLELSSLEAARERALALEPVACERLFKRVTSVVGAYAARKLIKLTVLTDEEVQPVAADEDRIVQVLVDLAENAVKFTPPRGTVKLSVSRHNHNYMRFSVTDTGLGMLIADQKRVFSAFSADADQLREPHDERGVGLAVCKEIVERHGGTIWVDSKRGFGSTFSFTLPVVSKHQATGTDPA